MTLILLAARQSDIVLVSDRRMSWNGAVQDDQLAKCGTIRTCDASAAYAFTGLVRDHHFDLRDLIGNALHGLPGDATFARCLELLSLRLTAKFRDNMTIRHRRAADRALTLAFAGFGPLAVPFVAIVSNFEGVLSDPGAVRDDFVHEILPLPARSAMASAAYVFGNRSALSQEQLMSFNRLLRGSPAVALKLKAIELIRMAGDNAISRGTIGPNLMALTMPATIPPYNPSVASHYVSPTGGNTLYLPDQIVIRRGGNIAIRNATISAEANVARPYVPQDAACWCGSGRPFRFCHGR